MTDDHEQSTDARGQKASDETGDESVTAAGGTPDPRFVGATDIHVHALPTRLLDAIRSALTAEAGWSFPHPTRREHIERVLQNHGVSRYVTLPYAHEPGMARELNSWVVSEAADSEMAVPFATVHPADDDVGRIVRDAFDAGAVGLKFQCPVQECGPADPRLDPAFEAAATRNLPVLFHAGTAPMFRESPHVGIEPFREFVASYPTVRVACAHMGTYDWEAFVGLARDTDRVFLDTSFAMSTAASGHMPFDPGEIPNAVFEDLAGQVMYGSDYPNVPHPYRAERAGLLARELSDAAYRQLFVGAADRFLGVE